MYVTAVFLVVLPGLRGSRDLIAKTMSSDLIAWLTRITFTGYLIHYDFLGISSYGKMDSTYIGL